MEKNFEMIPVCKQKIVHDISPAGGRLSGILPRQEAVCNSGRTLFFTGASMQLPYFKFMVNDYLSGKIQACSFITQGIFINLISRIWRDKGKFNTTEADLAALLHIDLGVLEQSLAELRKWNIIRTELDGSIHVCFIDEQLEELSQQHNAKVVAGRLGAQIKANKKASTTKAELKQSESDTESEKNIYTLEQCLAASEGIGMKHEDVKAFWNHYASVDFFNAAGLKITNLKAALGKWKAKQLSYGKKSEQSSRPLYIGELKTKLETLSTLITRACEGNNQEEKAKLPEYRKQKKEVEQLIANYK